MSIDTPPSPVISTTTSARNGLGLAALLVGIGAVVLAFIPFVSYVAWIVGITAIVLGIIAVRRSGRSKGGAVAGIVLGGVAIILAIVMSLIYTAIFALAAASGSFSSAGNQGSAGIPIPSSSDQSSASSSTAAAASRTVTYTVSGSGKATSISYFTVNNGESGSEQASDAKLPWKKSISIKDDDLFSSSIFSLVAQNSGSGAITCQIESDGKVISKHTSTGKYAVVACSGHSDQ